MSDCNIEKCECKYHKILVDLKTDINLLKEEMITLTKTIIEMTNKKIEDNKSLIKELQK